MTENTNDAQKDQKATHAEPAQKAESTETAGGTQRSEPAERAESTERAERTERPGRDERAERTGRDERAERSGRDERSEWAGRDERAGRTRSERTGSERAGSDRDPLSAATEEAFKLFETLQQKAARELRKNLIKGTMSGFGSAFSGGGRGKNQDVWEEAISEHDEYICRACPVCRAMAAQRESGGAVTDHLMQAGTELFAAFKSAVDGLNKPSSAQRARERGQEETPVEHIDLG
jgi:hypothetical protein